MRRTLACLALIAVAGSVAAAPAGHPAKVYTIAVDKLAFGPAPSGLRVGDVVRWANHDIFQHSATATDHSFDVQLRPNGVGQVTLTHAGTIAYTCRYHPAMKGQLVVRK